MSSNSKATQWIPAQLLSPGAPSTPYSLIILNQPLALRSTIYQALFKHATYTVAADGGANQLYSLLHPATPTDSSPLSPPSLPLSLIIGDLDSLSSKAREYFSGHGVRIIHDADQYSTDFGKAFNWLTAQRQKDGQRERDIVVVGGLGGRIDQGLSVLHHIYMFQSSPTYELGRMFLVSSESVTFLLKAGKHRIQVKQDAIFETGGKLRWGLGKHVGIIPMNGPSVITTMGLEWDVSEWKTEFGGQMSTSNWVKEEWVDIETSADVLFTIDIKTEAEDVAS